MRLRAAVVAAILGSLPEATAQPTATYIVPGSAGPGHFVTIGTFAEATTLTLKSTGSIELVAGTGFAWRTYADGSLESPVTHPAYRYANVGAKNYPVTGGGDGINRFPGGGANFDTAIFSPNGSYGIAGTRTTDTRDPGAIRFGAVVGTFAANPSPADWFLVGRGTTVAVPAGGGTLRLGVSESNNTNNSGGYAVEVRLGTTRASGARPPSELTHLSSGITRSGTGKDAYADLPEPLRSKCVRAWEDEIATVTAFVKSYEDQAAGAQTHADRARLQNVAKAGKDQLDRLKLNRVPFRGPVAYDEFVDSYRIQFVRAWEAEVLSQRTEAAKYGTLARALKAEAASPRSSVYQVKKYKEKSIEAEAKAEAALAALDVLGGNDPPYLAFQQLGPPEKVAVGDIGHAGVNWAVTVIQVVNDNRMLVSVETRAGAARGVRPVLLMVKCPTKGLTDGKRWAGPGWQSAVGLKTLMVSGTTTYETVDGGTRTVLVVEELDLDAIRKK